MSFEKTTNSISVVFIGMILTIFTGALLLRIGQRIGVIEPHVTILADKDQADQSAKQNELPEPRIPSAIDGEVTRTTERLKELGAVTLSLSLFAVGELIKGREIQTVDEIISGALRENLMPPGVFFEQPNGVLNVTHITVSGTRVSHGKLYVRYRPEPFDLEIVSMPLELRDRPMLLMRRPFQNKQNEAPTYYSALRLENVVVPEPFSKESTIIASGWTKEEIKTVDVIGQEQNELREWSSKQNSGHQ